MAENDKPNQRDDAESAEPLPDAPTVADFDAQPPEDLPGGVLTPGQQFGSYEVMRLLGKGGMGEVYEAYDARTERYVALKVLKERLSSETDRKRFLREGQIAAQVSHPNSVYVFGTEDIDGTQVISMELVPGGTLADRVKATGPLPFPEAVNVVRELIAGLKAAEAQGILHRDIKPSNCFLDADGRVKIGDYGLSISTQARDTTQLTATNTILGTPAFSSPEQLKGEELDARSDIYSLGATLYFLLTGRPPFSADTSVNLIANILAGTRDALEAHRPGIPTKLARAVSRCLSPARENRFAGYEELERTLPLHSSLRPKFAPPRTRILAGAIDSLILMAPSLIWSAPSPLPSLGRVAVDTLVAFAYYSILEGTLGGSLGKLALGLRIAGPDFGAAGLKRASMRAAVWILAPGIVGLAAYRWAFGPYPADQAFDVSLMLGTLVASTGLGVLSLVILFSTARRSNRYAGLHDLASGTRVLVLRRSREPARSSVTPAARTAETDASGRVGPYEVTARLYQGDRGELLAGYDPVLKRSVWIHRPAPGVPCASAERRRLARAGRLRWLTGGGEASNRWDAYEHVPGKGLAELDREGRRWAHARMWMVDLAAEIGTIAGTEPNQVTSLDHVWIGTDGRARLLDFPAPVASKADRESANEAVIADSRTGQLFLKQVILATVEGRTPIGRELEQAGLRVPGPARLRCFVSELGQPGVGAEHLAIQNAESRLRVIASGEPVVPRWKRALQLAVTSALPTLVFVIGLASEEATLGNLLMACAATGAVLAFTSLPATVIAVLSRGGAILSLLDVEVVCADGARASRRRAFARAVAAWSPTLLVYPHYDFYVLGFQIDRAGTVAAAITTALMALGAAYAVWSPERSIQDRIARTYLVPR